MDMICVWPDETWCFLEDIDSYGWRSDDYFLLSTIGCESEEDVEKLAILQCSMLK